MKVPIRPAPPPPTVRNNIHAQKPTSNWQTLTKDNCTKSTSALPKKKPPPRPPPPKFTNSKADKKQIPSRPSQLITNLFQRKNQNSSKIGDSKLSKSNSELSDLKASTAVTLIDFNSPPSSPTFTTRSSSDALSVNSFGSDGVTPCSTSSGNASNVESGFEDDFDFFGLSNNKRSENTQSRDPWSPPPIIQDRSRNPSPLASQNHQYINNKKGSWVTFSSPSSSKKVTQNVSAMPTIIRVKPERPQPPVMQKDSTRVSAKNMDLISDIFQSVHLNTDLNNHLYRRNLDDDDDDDEWSSCESPPMPTCPPPAPPPEILNGLLNDEELAVTECGKSYGIALYDYFSTQPEDLSFKENDVINLLRRIDENWYFGEKNGVSGSVPVNFVKIVVPLLNDEYASDRHVTALYAFSPETWDDLEFQEGSIIKVLSKIDQDWLFGEHAGKTGQFPANFVDRVPQNLPIRKVND